MKRSDKTSMGGEKSKFQTTDWDAIKNAKTLNAARQKEIIGNLIERYWKPVCCYLIRKGYENEHAKDLTQGFFHEIVLGKHLIHKADEAKGRFRTFLLVALRNYIIDCKRLDHQPRVTKIDNLSEDLPSQEMNPDEAFTYAWVSLLLDEVITEVERGCYEDGQEKHWKLFYGRILGPIMNGTKAPLLKELCKQQNIEIGNNKASNMIVTVKRRFGRVMEDHLRLYAESDSDVDDELNELFSILTEGCARS